MSFKTQGLVYQSILSCWSWWLSSFKANSPNDLIPLYSQVFLRKGSTTNLSHHSTIGSSPLKNMGLGRRDDFASYKERPWVPLFRSLYSYDILFNFRVWQVQKVNNKSWETSKFVGKFHRIFSRYHQAHQETKTSSPWVAPTTWDWHDKSTRPAKRISERQQLWELIYYTISEYT